MICRVPGFLAVVLSGSTHAPPPPYDQQVASLSQSSCVSLVELTEGMGGGGRGAESYDCKKAWPSLNHSMLSGCHAPRSSELKKPGVHG
jgi:hypothetical protein